MSRWRPTLPSVVRTIVAWPALRPAVSPVDAAVSVGVKNGAFVPIASWTLPAEPAFDPSPRTGGFDTNEQALFDFLGGESFEAELDGAELASVRLRALAADGTEATLFALGELSLYP
jgi:hypothetical protein